MEPQPSQNHHQPVQDYLAFISYRHADNTEEDRQWATWLHQQLEVYDIPADLIGATNLRGERIPERIYPVFRDEISLPADADLSNAVTQALDRSRFLIVLCSPRAVQSHYVNQEILHFKQSGKEERIIAAMICGEPNASVDDAKQENPEDICTQECFPEALQYELGSDGTLDTRKRTEPIAADFRLPDGSEGATNPNTYKRQLLQDGHNKADAERLAQRYEEQLNNAKLKIIAGILGVRLEQLTQRDKFYQLGKARAAARRFRRIAVSMGGLALAATIAGGLAYQQWQRAAEERDRADSLLAQVRKNLDFINYGLRDVMKAYVPTEKRIPLMQLVDGIVEILQQTGSRSDEDQLLIAFSLIEKANLILKNDQLNPSDALSLYQRAKSIIHKLVKRNPGNTKLQRELAASYSKVGDTQLRIGNTQKALENFQASLDTVQPLAKSEPTNTQFQRDLAVYYDRLGEIQFRLGNLPNALEYYKSSLTFRQKLAINDPENTQLQANLAVSHNQLGDLKRRLGSTLEAMESYQSSFGIRQTLAQNDPTNLQFQRPLATAHERLGDVQLLLGNSQNALKEYQATLAVLMSLAQKDPGNSQLKGNLAVSHIQLGDVQLRLGNTRKALKHYQTSLSLRQSLLKNNPGDSQLKRGLATSHSGLGRVQSHLGHTRSALDNFKVSLSLLQTLVKNDPENSQLLRDLAVSHSQLGAAQLRIGDIPEAAGNFEASRSISHALVQKSPENIQFQRDLFVSHYKLAGVFESTKDYSTAYKSLALAHKQLTRMKEAGILQRDDEKFIDITSKQMLQLKTQMDGK